MLIVFWSLALILMGLKSAVSPAFFLPAVILTTLFWGLTAEVNRTEIRLYFGLGLIGRTICRQRIAQVAQVRNRWWYGWGIRLTPHGWMWSMGGLDAVELTYQNNKRFRIGTDQPQALLKASADN